MSDTWTAFTFAVALCGVVLLVLNWQRVLYWLHLVDLVWLEDTDFTPHKICLRIVYWHHSGQPYVLLWGGQRPELNKDGTLVGDRGTKWCPYASKPKPKPAGPQLTFFNTRRGTTQQWQNGPKWVLCKSCNAGPQEVGVGTAYQHKPNCAGTQVHQCPPNSLAAQALDT